MAEQFDVAVIGSGPGGYVAAIRCAQLGLKTACIEKDNTLGGTCLNVGCIPSKALLQSTEHLAWLQKESEDHGITCTDVHIDFKKMMERKQKIVNSHVEGIKWLFGKNKISHIEGLASLSSQNEIEIKKKSGKIEKIQAKSIIIATGSEPISLPFLPFDEKKIVSSTGVLSLAKIPKNLLVIGAGVIGVELASVYNRLGAHVKVIEMLDKICPALDQAVGKMLQTLLKKQGLEFHLSAKVVKAEKKQQEIALTVEEGGKTNIYESDVVLISIGRKPFISNLGLDKAGIQTNAKGFITVDGNFRTSASNIFAIGDCIEGPLLAHRASEEGIAVAEILAGEKPEVNYLSIPNVIYTHPEAASVGLTEEEAKSLGLQLKIGTCLMRANSRARCSGYVEGMVKIIAEEKTGKILGIHLLCEHASEMIGEAVLAIKNRLSLEELASLSHAHPTLSEAIKEAALNALGRAIHF